MTSKRLQSAALAEITRLQKRRARLGVRMAPLVAEDDDLAERIEAIRAAVGLNQTITVHKGTVAPRPGGTILSGRAIRVQAVRSMMARHPLGHAAHYAQWYAAFAEDGYAIYSPDPVAAFLTQLGRSPWVVRSSQKGVYALADEDVVARLDDQAALAYRAVHDTNDPDEQLVLFKRARAYAKKRDEAALAAADQEPTDG